jgi:hypothetical protein
LKESTRPLTAFKTHRGLYEFKVMPFGVINGPPVFQRFMNEIFASILWNYILVYIDDLIIYSQSFEDHLLHLKRVFEILIEAKLTLSPKKCHFGYQSVTILGQNISRLGLSALKEKVQAIADMPPPTNLKELRTAMGIFQYYASYIPFASTLMAPFYKMMRKGESFKWDEEKQELFEALKDALRSSPILIYGNDQEAYRMYSDASKEGIAATLQQLYTIKLRDLKHTRIYTKCKQAFEKGEPVPNFVWKAPEGLEPARTPDQWAEDFEDTEITLEGLVAAVSRTYKAAELNYSATEMEALALIYGLLKFMPRLESSPRILAITDHAALMFMGIFKDTGRLARWGTIISKLAPRLSIIHKAGRVHNNVDTLSRRLGINTHPYYQTPVEIPDSNLKREDKDHMLKQYEKEVDIAEVAAVITKLDWNQEFLNQFIAHYDSDMDVKEILDNIRNETNLVTPKYSNFQVNDQGLLIFKDADDNERIYVPEGMKREVLKMAHDDLPQGNHGGPLKTLGNLLLQFYWKKMEKDAKRYAQTCLKCQAVNPRTQLPHGKLQALRIPQQPYERITMDFVELPEALGYSMVLAILDYLTKHLTLLPTTKTISALETAQLVYKEIFLKWGVAKEVISDRDPRWREDFWKYILYALGAERKLSTSHHPQTDGATEAVNKTVENHLRKCVDHDLKNWPSLLPEIEAAYNSTPHTATGVAPFTLLTGFNMRTLKAFNVKEERELSNRDQGVADFIKAIHTKRQLARDIITLNQQSYIEAYNKKHKFIEFKVGDQVWIDVKKLHLLGDNQKRHKLLPKYAGPYEIIEKISDLVFKVRLPPEIDIHPYLNIDKLQLHRPSPEEFGEREPPPQVRLEHKSVKDYEVAYITAERKVKKTRKNKSKYFMTEYQAVWLDSEGKQYWENSWIPRKNFANAPEVLREWDLKQKNLEKN